jgi:hypothetical protein
VLSWLQTLLAGLPIFTILVLMIGLGSRYGPSFSHRLGFSWGDPARNYVMDNANYRAATPPVRHGKMAIDDRLTLNLPKYQIGSLRVFESVPEIVILVTILSTRNGPCLVL